MTAHPPTPASRLAAGATLLVGLLLLPRMLAEPPLAILLLEGVGLVVAVVAGLGIWLVDTFEARLFAVLLSLVVLAATLLSVTVGLPGLAGAEPLTATRGALVTTCLATNLLLVLDARLRRAARESARRPYAL